MPILSEEPANHPGTHLLLVGPTKSGKTKYLASMAIDGFHIVYVDNDNGYNTLMAALAGHEEAKTRVYYIPTQNIWDFCLYFFGRTLFSWNLTKDELYSKSSADPDDIIVSWNRKAIPRGIVFAFDSWTSISLRLLEKAAKTVGTTIEDFKDKGQDAFGSANRSANQMLMNLQGFPNPVVMQAHPDHYEIRVNPPGNAKESAKQANQIIKANVEIPYSVSRPHGLSMGKFFSEIGWMGVSNVGHFELDFKQQKDRIGGGSPGGKGDPMKEYRFSKLFGAPESGLNFDWIEEIPASVIADRMRESDEAEAAAKAKAKAESGIGAQAPQPAAKRSSLLK